MRSRPAHISLTDTSTKADALWLSGDRERWRCYLDIDWEFVFYCHDCDEREFDGRLSDSV